MANDDPAGRNMGSSAGPCLDAQRRERDIVGLDVFRVSNLLSGRVVLGYV